MGFFGGQILGSVESLSKWLKSWAEIRDVGERKTEERDKPFVHILFFS